MHGCLRAHTGESTRTFRDLYSLANLIFIFSLSQIGLIHDSVCVAADTVHVAMLGVSMAALVLSTRVRERRVPRLTRFFFQVTCTFSLLSKLRALQQPPSSPTATLAASAGVPADFLPSSSFSPAARVRRLTLAFYGISAVVSFGVIMPWLHLLLGMNPLQWYARTPSYSS